MRAALSLSLNVLRFASYLCELNRLFVDGSQTKNKWCIQQYNRLCHILSRISLFRLILFQISPDL